MHLEGCPSGAVAHDGRGGMNASRRFFNGAAAAKCMVGARDPSTVHGADAASSATGTDNSALESSALSSSASEGTALDSLVGCVLDGSALDYLVRDISASVAAAEKAGDASECTAHGDVGSAIYDEPRWAGTGRASPFALDGVTAVAGSATEAAAVLLATAAPNAAERTAAESVAGWVNSTAGVLRRGHRHTCR